LLLQEARQPATGRHIVSAADFSVTWSAQRVYAWDGAKSVAGVAAFFGGVEDSKRRKR